MSNPESPTEQQAASDECVPAPAGCPASNHHDCETVSVNGRSWGDERDRQIRFGRWHALIKAACVRAS
jgi:hypothetical protein